MENKERETLTEGILDGLITEMHSRLKLRQPCDMCGCLGLSSTDIANVIKFLKDNGFDVHREQTASVLDELKKNRRPLPDPAQDPGYPRPN